MHCPNNNLNLHTQKPSPHGWHGCNVIFLVSGPAKPVAFASSLVLTGSVFFSRKSAYFCHRVMAQLVFPMYWMNWEKEGTVRPLLSCKSKFNGLQTGHQIIAMTL